MKSQVTATGIVRDYLKRGIDPDFSHNVSQGTLYVWIWCNQSVGRLMIGDLEMTGECAYVNTINPQTIADDIYNEAGGALTTALINPSQAAAALGSITSKKKAEASRANASKPPRPGKRPRGRPKKQN